MARAGVTVFQIHHAANALAAEGNPNPSNDDVRLRLGSGSMSTITPAMRTWREQRQRDQGQSGELPEPLLAAIAGLRQALLADAQRYVDDGWCAIDAELIQAQDARAAADRQQRETASLLQSLREQLAAAQGVRAELELQLRTEAAVRARAETQRDELVQAGELRSSELVALRREKGALERALAEATQVLVGEQRAHGQARERVETLEAALAAAESRAREYQEEKDAAAANCEQLTGDCTQLTMALEAAAQREATTEDQLTAERARHIEAVQRLERQLIRAEEALGAANAALAAKEAGRRELEAARQAEAKVFQEQLAAIREEARSQQSAAAAQLQELIQEMRRLGRAEKPA